MQLYQGNFRYAAMKALELAATHTNGIAIAVSDEMYFAVGKQPNTHNLQSISELNGDIYEGQWNGGTCVVFPGDLSLCMINNTITDFAHVCLDKIQEYLTKRGLIVRKTGNDLLLYEYPTAIGRKVASCGDSYKEDKYFEAVVHVSIGMDEGIINQVCTKKQTKRPMGLGQYGITAEQVLAYLKTTVTELAENN